MISNHLTNQKNPYLLQHANNPVDWYPWCLEALQKAQKEQKPIFLSIGYSTCHWCHVMAHESFENQEIADILNQFFISIKVDREERPDLDQIYMTAVTAMTGQGGWPLSVFLTPQGKPFYGGTYFPPLAKWGSPGFMDLLKNIAQAWDMQRDQILTSSEEITQLLLEQSKKFFISSQIPGTALLESAYQQISSQFDYQNGGFGKSPKFPMGHYLSFLMRYYKRNGDPKILEMVETTLTAIAKGGIYDHVGGGFHRYSTDPYWHVPHFEKMLYDQALLVRAYLECYQLTSKDQYARIAQQTLDYVLRDMQNSNGGFYCAEDADSEIQGSNHKSEGAFYIWSQKEIQEILNEETGVFNYAFGIKEEGNAQFDPHGEFVGRNILYVAHSIEETAKHFEMSVPQVKDLLDESKRKLFLARSTRIRPHLDDKVLTDWNGLILGVLSFAGAVLNEPRYLKAAKKSADFILNNLKSDTHLLHCWVKEEVVNVSGNLEDYAFLINGLLDLYEVSFEEKYFIQAQELANSMIDLFQDDKQGGFYLTAKDAPNLIIRPKEIYDGAIPSGNSIAVYVLLRLYLLTSDIKWMNSVEKWFLIFSDTIEKNPSAYTFTLCAFDFYLGPSLSIILEGRRDDQTLVHMRQMVYKYFIPNKSVLFRFNNSLATVYICNGNNCQKPTQELKELEAQLVQSYKEIM